MCLLQERAGRAAFSASLTCLRRKNGEIERCTGERIGRTHRKIHIVV